MAFSLRNFKLFFLVFFAVFILFSSVGAVKSEFFEGFDEPSSTTTSTPPPTTTTTPSGSSDSGGGIISGIGDKISGIFGGDSDITGSEQQIKDRRAELATNYRSWGIWKDDEAKVEYENLGKDLTILAQQKEISSLNSRLGDAVTSIFNKIWAVAEYFIVPVAIVYFVGEILSSFLLWLLNFIFRIFGKKTVGKFGFLNKGESTSKKSIIDIIKSYVTLSVLLAVVWAFLKWQGWTLGLATIIGWIRQFLLWHVSTIINKIGVSPTFLSVIIVFAIVLIFYVIIGAVVAYFIRSWFRSRRKEEVKESVQELGENLRTTREVAESVSESIED